jgi:hypothetical protein
MCLTGEMTASQVPLISIGAKRRAKMLAYKKIKKQASLEQSKFGKRLIQARAK